MKLIFFLVFSLSADLTRNKMKKKKKKKILLSHMHTTLIPVCSTLMLPNKLDGLVEEVSSDKLGPELQPLPLTQLPHHARNYSDLE